MPSAYAATMTGCKQPSVGCILVDRNETRAAKARVVRIGEVDGPTSNLLRASRLKLKFKLRAPHPPRLIGEPPSDDSRRLVIATWGCGHR